jgi:hypothetical protein
MWRNCHILEFNPAENLNESGRLLMKSTLFALATAAALLAGLGQTFAAPNVTDLSVFRGRAAGTGDVKISNGADYHGKVVIRPTIKSGGLAATFKIVGNVSVSGHSVPVSNQFTFAARGKFLGKELAPGDTSGFGTKGKFTATGSTITFDGKFKVATTTGTFNGTVQKFGNGRLKIIYSVFVGDSTTPLYVYTYSGK